MLEGSGGWCVYLGGEVVGEEENTHPMSPLGAPWILVVPVANRKTGMTLYGGEVFGGNLAIASK
jgi:hypothetical protein